MTKNFPSIYQALGSNSVRHAFFRSGSLFPSSPPKSTSPATHIHKDKHKLEEAGVITMVTVELNTTDLKEIGSY